MRLRQVPPPMMASRTRPVWVSALLPIVIGLTAVSARGGIALLPGETSGVVSLAEVGIGEIDGVRIEGVAVGDYAGFWSAGAGDVNGDGIEDVLISAYNAGRTSPDLRDGYGESYVVLGSQGPLGEGGALSLAAPGAADGGVLRGANPIDYAGASCATAGDVNGDGHDDLLIGAPFASPGGVILAGEAYLVLGTPSGVDDGGVVALAELDGVRGVRFVGQEIAGTLGISVAPAGDINADGLDDFMIASHNADNLSVDAPEEETGRGIVYLFFGTTAELGSGGVLAPSEMPPGAGVRFRGVEHGDNMGFEIAGVGDFNGDGISDLLMGAPHADAEDPERDGVAYLIYGREDGFASEEEVDLSLFTVDDGVEFLGARYEDELGFALGPLGDFNGDGYADIALGAQGPHPPYPFDGRPGEAYIVFGGPDVGGSTGVVEVAGLDGSVGIRFLGREPDGWFGVAAGGAGDMNGDGFADLLLGASITDPEGREDAGEVYLLWGSEVPPVQGGPFNVGDLVGERGVRMEGELAFDWAGGRVAAAGDVNADGLSDFLIGASRIFGQERGVTHLIHGHGAPPAATYRAHARPDDAPTLAVGTVGAATRVPMSRCWIDFADGHGPGNGRASLQAVTLTRHGAGLRNLGQPHADVAWEIATDRTEWTSARVTLQ